MTDIPKFAELVAGIDLPMDLANMKSLHRLHEIREEGS